MGGGHDRLDLFICFLGVFAFFSDSLLVGGQLFIAWLGGFLYSTGLCVWIWLIALVAISNVCINVHLHPLILSSAYLIEVIV